MYVIMKKCKNMKKWVAFFCKKCYNIFMIIYKGEKLLKVDATVKRETKYIAYFTLILSLIMQVVFILLKSWDYTVLLGNLLSLAVAILNFLFLGITVQKAVTMDTDDAKKLMRSSKSLRTAGMFVAIAIGVAAPCFNTIAVIIPLFFPRIAITFRPLIKDKKDVIDK